MGDTIALLKICARAKDLSQGTRIHAHLLKRGFSLERSPHVATTLIHMYVKCGDLANARRVHDEFRIRNAVSWNALISGYSRETRGHETWECAHRMIIEGLLPDSVTLVCVLKSCAVTRDMLKGKQVHCTAICRNQLEKNVMMGTALVDMYAKCGMLEKAHKVLEELSVRDVVAWNALISGYIQQERCQKGLCCFREMQNEGFPPDVVTYGFVLKACGMIRDIEMGKRIHKETVDRDLVKKNVMLSNALVDMYAKCGFLDKAKEVLEGIPVPRSVIAWSTLIAGYTEHGQGLEALKCFERMIGENCCPDEVTFVCILKACARARAIDKGRQVHDEIVNRGFLPKNIVLGTALVDMYVKCGMLVKAQQVLEELSVRDVVSWSVLIAGYSQEGRFQDALNCFEQMQSEGSYPDAVTLVSVLKACGSIGAIEKGRMIHDKVQRMGLISENIELGTALVDMYAKCGMLVKASQVLEELTHRDVVSWNALIAGYTQCGQAREALHCFEKMQDDGVIPDAVTFTCILKACRSIGDVIAGEEIYEEIISRGLLESNVVLSTALVDLFARCGLLAKAQNLHDNVCTQSVASWNALICGYAHEGQQVEAMNCFQVMERQGFIPDSVTFICILQACGNTGAIERAGEIHEKILSRDLLGKNLVLGAALVEMYVKCGNLSKAWSLVQGFPFQNIALWNSLMAGYSQKGESSKALSLFKRIQSEGVVIPDAITFLSVLCACCRLGLWEEAEVRFGQMTRECGIVPELEHYSCMVAVYGSAGRLDKAMSVIEGMPCRDYPTVWLALLAACRTWGNVSLGRIAFHEVIRLDSSCAAAYALMANVFTSNGMPDDALEVECMQAKLGNFDGNLDKLSLLF